MDSYLLLVVLLFSLSALGLIVGVSNDAVNFLNSSLGSKVASMRTILIVASLGVLLGTTFSSGMMEVARKSVFNPGYFSFHALMFIFVAVMLTNVILLDIYNTLGFPTSTTVSLVFTLFGAGASIGFLTAIDSGLNPFDFGDYINVETTVDIVQGIFSSVGIAFVAGIGIQWLARLACTYKLEDSLPKWGGVFSGIAATLIINFLIFKGLKGSSFLTKDVVETLLAYQNTILACLFVLFTVVAQGMIASKKVNPLRYVVLLGTFSLAMAFAGNDLVNFIGVAVAAFQAYGMFVSSGMDARELIMDSMAKEVETPTLLLILAGLIMIFTLWTSAKARKVSATQIGLSRQGEGAEKFKPNTLSRWMVSAAGGVSETMAAVSSARFQSWTDDRFQTLPPSKDKDAPAFDLVRAAVDLMVASSLIAYATSLGLPLSTTYVVFMVGMGSSLADRAWGRESAVYRVAGVLNVIGGWLLTAAVAFIAAALFAAFLFYGEFIAALILTVFAIGQIVRSNMGFAKKMKSENLVDDEVYNLSLSNDPVSMSRNLMAADIRRSANIVSMAGEALVAKQKRSSVRLNKEIEAVVKRQRDLELKMTRVLKDLKLEEGSQAAVHLMAFDYICDLSQSARIMVEEQYAHLANFHKEPHSQFLLAYADLLALFNPYMHRIVVALESGRAEPHADLLNAKRRIVMDINRGLELDIQRYRQGELTTRQTHLQTKLLLELRDMAALAYRVHKVYFG